MPANFAWSCTCLLALVLCAVLEPSQGQGCSTEKLENITVDIRAALSKGIRGTDPIHTTSWESCVNVCCTGKEVADKKCNLVVFNGRRKGNYPNCYFFYYPSKEPFPMNQSVGLVTGRIVTDADILKPAPTSNKLSHFTEVTEKSVSPPVHTPTKPSSWLRSLPTAMGSKREENVSHTQKPNFKTNSSSQNTNGEGAKQSKSSDSSLTHAVGSSLLLNISSTIKHVVPMLQPTVLLPSLTSGTPSSTVPLMLPSVSPSRTATTSTNAAYYRNTLVVTKPRKSPSTPQPASNGTGSISRHLLPSSAPDTLPDLPVTEKKLEMAGSVSVGVSGEENLPLWGGKYILLATLLLGTMFLLLVTVQMGRKMLESRRQKRYTRLDYLINGMYANM